MAASIPDGWVARQVGEVKEKKDKSEKKEKKIYLCHTCGQALIGNKNEDWVATNRFYYCMPCDPK